MKNLFKSKKGIGLIELLVVLGILVIFAAIGVSEFSSFGDRARRDRALDAAKSLMRAYHMYKVEYPEGFVGVSEMVQVIGSYVNVTTLANNFVRKKPVNPLNISSIDPNVSVVIFSNLSPYQKVECIYGAVKGIPATATYDYWIIFCTETDETSPNTWDKGANQPSCYWEIRNPQWQDCSKGL